MKKTLLYLITFITAFGCTNSNPQNNIESKDTLEATNIVVGKIKSSAFECDYFGEEPPELTPKIFAPNIIELGNVASVLYINLDISLPLLSSSCLCVPLLNENKPSNKSFLLYTARVLNAIFLRNFELIDTA